MSFRVSGPFVPLRTAGYFRINARAMSAAVQFTEEASGAFESLQSREARDRLTKWNLDSMRCVKFRFDQRFDPENPDEFLSNFFASEVEQKAAPVSAGKSAGSALLGDVSSVCAERLSTRVLRMDFWDRRTPPLSPASLTARTCAAHLSRPPHPSRPCLTFAAG